MVALTIELGTTCTQLGKQYCLCVHLVTVLLDSAFICISLGLRSPPVVYVGATGPVTECENVLTQVRDRHYSTYVCVVSGKGGTVGVAVILKPGLSFVMWLPSQQLTQLPVQ